MNFEKKEDENLQQLGKRLEDVLNVKVGFGDCQPAEEERRQPDEEPKEDGEAAGRARQGYVIPRFYSRKVATKASLPRDFVSRVKKYFSQQPNGCVTQQTCGQLALLCGLPYYTRRPLFWYVCPKNKGKDKFFYHCST